MRYYLVRHGQTLWNQSKKWQGWSDVALDDIGLIQAKLLANYFKHIEIDHIYSSDLSRSLKTAHIINIDLERRITLTKALREMNIGEWEGKTWEEIQVEFEDDIKKNKDQLYDMPITGGESLLAFQQRVVDAFDLIKDKHHGQHVLIVTHGGVIRVLLCHLLGYDLTFFDQLKIDNASVTIIEQDADQGLKVIKQNDLSHLKHT